MPVYINDITSSGTAITANPSTDHIIAGGATITSTAGIALFGSGSDISVYVAAGSTVRGDRGLFVGDALATSNSVELDAGAFVAGTYFGVYLGGDGSSLVNRGQIAGSTYGVIFQVAQAGQELSITNSGQIIGGASALICNGLDAGQLIIDNSGQIISLGTAFEAASNNVTQFTNSGEIRGNMQFGNLNDSLDTAAGTIAGTINMGAGNDTLRPGMEAEVADGGDGVDLLDFSTTGAVRVFLDASLSNRGAAAADAYTGFENIRGSATGNDVLGGDAAANRLQGLGGNDTLDGKGGADTMEGGAGNDVYFIDAAGDVVVELANRGTDTLRTTVSLTLGANVENGVVISALGQTLSGNGLANTLTGGVGNDTLRGLAGNDTLNGGNGGDSL